DAGALLDLEGEGALGQPGRRCRPEKVCPLQRPIRVGELLEAGLDDALKQSERLLKRVRPDRAMSRGLPGYEEPLEDVVEELSTLARVETSLLIALLLEPQDVTREVLEWTIQVPLDVAHGVLNRLARAGRAVEAGIGRRDAS